MAFPNPYKCTVKLILNLVWFVRLYNDGDLGGDAKAINDNNNKSLEMQDM